VYGRLKKQVSQHFFGIAATEDNRMMEKKFPYLEFVKADLEEEFVHP
jgi:hypothetical protein